jgi:hypothetical protein
MARYYVGATGKVWTCVLKKLRLLDVRMMKYMLLEALAHVDTSVLAQQWNSGSKSTQPNTIAYYLQSFMLSYGLRPLYEQGETDLIQPLENFGYRKSYTDRDDYAVALMKYIFYPEFDGYIGPVLKQSDAPGSVEFHHELCLFNPSQSIESTKYGALLNNSDMDEEYTTIEIADIIKNKHYLQNGVGITVAFPSAQTGGRNSTAIAESPLPFSIFNKSIYNVKGNVKGNTSLNNANVASTNAKTKTNVQKFNMEEKYNLLVSYKSDELEKIRKMVHSQITFDLYCSDD